MNANLAVGMFRKSAMTLADVRIRFFAPDVAAAQCEWEIVGTIDYDGKGSIAPRKYSPLFIVAENNGSWTIAVMHNLLFQPLPPGAIIGPPPKE